MPYKHKLLPLLLLLPLLNSCRDEPEQIPAYLELRPFEVQEPGGAAEHKITEGWLYVNGAFLGGYTLPATVPVLEEGESTIIVYPGVKENGIASTPALYSPMQRYETTATLAPNQDLVVQAVTEYASQTVALWSAAQSEFDISSVPLEPLTDFTLTADGAYAGRSVLMQVDTADPLDAVLTNLMALPNTGNREIWLELHYQNDIPFSVWVVGETGIVDRPVFQFNPRETWNKIYINLTPFVAVAPLEDRYLLRFVVNLLDASGNPVRGSVRFDNLKLLYI